MNNQNKSTRGLAIQNADLGAVLGEPGTGMSFNLDDVIKNYVKANPEAVNVETILIDRGESWASKL